jgi:ATP-dependent DNA helicase DinG
MTWIDAEEAFAAHFDRYEPRVPQRQLAQRIEAALAEGVNLMAEAPTGTGKSYAGLVPAIDFAVAARRPICAATGTKALQDQYILDLEALKAMYYPDLKFVIIKGRGNYLCRAKLAEIEKGKSPAPLGIEMDTLLSAAEVDGVNGDLDRMGLTLQPRERMALTATADECPGKNSCPFGNVCFAERVKAKAAEANVVVANHALVAVDAVLKAQGIEMLPPFSAMIIDEAHEFEGYVSNALGTSITERALTDLAARVVDFTGDRESLGKANVSAKLLFDKLRFILRQSERPNETTVAITPALLLQLESELGSVLRMLAHFEGKLAMTEAFTDEDVIKRRRLRKRVTSMTDKVKAIVLADFADMVRWIEVESKERYDGSTVERLSLEQAPLDVAPFLAQALWPWQPNVLMSATLSIGGDFSYLAGRLGLTGLNPDLPTLQTFRCPTPFDYQKQSVTYVPHDMPHPVKEQAAFRSAVNLHMAELVRASDGRALLLFTSKAGLESAHRALKPVIEQMGHRVLKQYDAPTRMLAEQFKADEHSVLFATKSFFTGMDIQGDALRLLVVDKLPFPVPSVLFKAQCDAIDARAGGSFNQGSFMTRQVPEMQITLTQAIGRLIRSTSDRGLAVVLDPRLHIMPSYGKRTLKALQTTFPSPLVTELGEAIAYLRSLEPQIEEVPV